jgi:hypothetical protein
MMTLSVLSIEIDTSPMTLHQLQHPEFYDFMDIIQTSLKPIFGLFERLHSSANLSQAEGELEAAHQAAKRRKVERSFPLQR